MRIAPIPAPIPIPALAPVLSDEDECDVVDCEDEAVEVEERTVGDEGFVVVFAVEAEVSIEGVTVVRPAPTGRVHS